MQRLGNPHRQPHTGGELRDAQAGELARRAVQMIGRLLPCGTAGSAGGIERAVEFLQVPTQPMRFIRQGKWNGSAWLGYGDERLGRDAQPTQQE